MLGMIPGMYNMWVYMIISYFGIFIATIFVGYLVDTDYMNGAIHGSLVVLIGIIIGSFFALFSLTALFTSVATLGNIGALIITIFMYGFIGAIFNMIIGAIGGVIGVFFSESTSYPLVNQIMDILIETDIKIYEASIKLIKHHLNKFSNSSKEGYLICNKCQGYYQLENGESPDDFSLKCKCSGSLKYNKDLIASSNNESISDE